MLHFSKPTAVGHPLSFGSDTEVDPVALAELLISDGHWDRAERALSGAAYVEKDDDYTRFHALLGLIYLNTDRADQAVAPLERAIAREDASPLTNLHLAQAYLATKQAEQALSVLDKASAILAEFPDTGRIRARVYWTLGDFDQAADTLLESTAAFPEDIRFQQDLFALYMELGLVQAAVETGRALLAKAPDRPDLWLAQGEAFRQAKQLESATVLLEEARLHYPEHEDLALLTARVYLDAEQPLAAGTILQQAASRNSDLYFETAECFRMAKQQQRALYFNSLVTDLEAKARQRLGMFIDEEEWTRALALGPRLARLSLDEEDKIAYALAYAGFQVRDFERAEAYLKTISEPSLFRDATALRQQMMECQQSGWRCR